VLGMGGAGVLYRARHVRTGRDVALKMLNGRAHDPQVAALRLEREALAAVSVRHPNVVEVLDLGEDQAGRPFLVLELLTGSTLHQRLERVGALTPQATFELALPLLGVLALAHERGLLHRDIKPANVFLSDAPDGQVVPKLLDFGIAKVEGGAELTQPGRLIGTAGYMAPEHVQGGELSAASDLWSLGALLYTCLVGCAPFPAEAMSAASAPPFPRHGLVTPEAIALLLVIERALEWSVRARYPDARSFARALLAVAHQKGLAIPHAPDPIGLPAWRAWCTELRAQPLGLQHTRAPDDERSPLSPSPASLLHTDVHASPWPHVGQVLAGRFELRRALGRGAMGAVYESRSRCCTGSSRTRSIASSASSARSQM
jgi:serine/threonine protein kinase